MPLQTPSGTAPEPPVIVLGVVDAEAMVAHLQALGREERAFRLNTTSAAPDVLREAVRRMLAAGLCFGIREPATGRLIYLGQAVRSDRPGGLELAFSATPDARGGLTFRALAWLLPRAAAQGVRFLELRFNPFNPAMAGLLARLGWRREVFGDDSRAVFDVPRESSAVVAQVAAWLQAAQDRGLSARL